jgi:hypothetical protein
MKEDLNWQEVEGLKTAYLSKLGNNYIARLTKWETHLTISNADTCEIVLQIDVKGVEEANMHILHFGFVLKKH